MSIDCYVGIDLGSTTTKSVVIDGRGEILGRGITNSRSNYDLACEIARTEAFIDAQMSRLRSALDALPILAEHARVLGPSLERNFRRQQHVRQLEHLHELCLEAADGEPGLRRVLDEILTEMRVETDRLFGGLSGVERLQSEFFRDIAGGQFQRLAEDRADARHLTYDRIVGVYDRAILRVENEAHDLSFESNARPALERAVATYGKLDPRATDGAFGALDGLLGAPPEVRCSVGTGYGRARLPFPKNQIRSEILCHGLGAHRMFPNTRTVLDIGGQDTKAIQVDGEGIVTSFQMNDRCAAGCGRYLGYIADEMNLGVHQLGPLAQRSTRRVRISSTCTVFAGAELRERLALGEKREDILAGLHRAIVLRAMSILARSGGVDEEFSFTGGVAHNEAAVQALRDLIEENYGERTLNISPDSIYMGALGAAIFARREADAGAADAPDPEERAAEAMA